MSLSHEDSHRWSVENRKSRSSWNVGNKPNLVKDRYSYSPVRQALENPDWCRCSKTTWRTNLMCAGNVGVWSTLRTRHCFLSQICSNGYCGLKPMRLLTRNWRNSNTH